MTSKKQRISNLLAWSGWVGLAVIVSILIAIINGVIDISIWTFNLDEPPRHTNVEILLDTSEAMGELMPLPFGEEQKLALGVEAVEVALEHVVSSRHNLGFRLFGGVCEGEVKDKTQLVVPFELDNKDRVRRELSKIRSGGMETRGETTLTASIIEAVEDLQDKSGSKSIIVITASGETCKPDLAADTIRQALLREGVLARLWFIAIGFNDEEKKPMDEIAEAISIGGEVRRVFYVDTFDDVNGAVRAIMLEDFDDPIPTFTPTLTPTATNVPQVLLMTTPTAMPASPTPADTPLPPIPENTSVPEPVQAISTLVPLPTSTATPKPMSTPIPVPTPTENSIFLGISPPTPTSIVKVMPTDTPVPTATPTQVSSSTSAPISIPTMTPTPTPWSVGPLNGVLMHDIRNEKSERTEMIGVPDGVENFDVKATFTNYNTDWISYAIEFVDIAGSRMHRVRVWIWDGDSECIIGRGPLGTLNGRDRPYQDNCQFNMSLDGKNTLAVRKVGQEIVYWLNGELKQVLDLEDFNVEGIRLGTGGGGGEPGTGTIDRLEIEGGKTIYEDYTIMELVPGFRAYRQPFSGE